jgi:hypothetical protein
VGTPLPWAAPLRTWRCALGVRAWLRHQRMRDPVTGTLRVASCSGPPSSVGWSRCELSGEVTAPGIAPAPVGFSCPAPARKWPQAGQDLPVKVDRAGPQKLVILWDEVAPSRDAGEAQEHARLLEEQAEATADTGAGLSLPVTAQAPGDDGTGTPGEVMGQTGSLHTGTAHTGTAHTGTARAGTAQGDTGLPTAGATPSGSGMRPAQTMVTGYSQPGLAGGLSADQAAGLLLNPGGLLRASATVVDVREVKSPDGISAAAGVVDLSLEVSTASGPDYPAALRIGFSTPQRRVSIATVGTVLPVLVDPVEKDRVVIDMSLFRD